MTAQAGAVGVVYSELDGFHEVRRKCAELRGAYAQTLPDGTPLYTTPPAAVPVEALEGLVDRLNALEEYADEARVAYAGDHSSGTFRRIAERTQGIRDELTQLIKECSNG